LSDASGAQSTPTPKIDRLVGIDALRGFAVLGILMMNVQGFAMIGEAYQWPPAQMDLESANLTVWAVARTFFAVKFITIFSALFGAGVVLMVGEGPDTGRHYRRMLWLLLFGAIHAYVFWWGDILFSYALGGMLAVRARRMSVRSLTIFGLSLIGLTALLMIGALASLNLLDELNPNEMGFSKSPEDLADTVALYQSGFVDRLPYNFFNALGGQAFGLIMFGGRIIGVMFIGMALFKSGFLKSSWSTGAYLITALIGLGVGLGLSGYSAVYWIERGFDLREMWASDGLNYVGSLFAAMGYAAVFMLLAKSGAIKAVINVFAATGRMALTNYLSQTLIMTFIFVGFPGLGFFGEVERTGQAALVLGVWALQLTWSPLWLARFQFGPMEWVWRSLTYGRAVPIRKAYYDKPAPEAAAEEEAKPE
jgi:uncharacterized protein